MTPKTLRRRLHHGDIDGKVQEHLDTSENLDASSEPLLEDADYNKRGIQKLDNSKVSTLEDIWNDERKREQLHWTFLYSQLITQWAQTLGRWTSVRVSSSPLSKSQGSTSPLSKSMGALGSRSLISRLLSHSPNAPNRQINRMFPPPLSPSQEERLRHVQERLQVSFDGSRTEHQDALKQLWKLAFPDRGLPPLKSELWKEMGWQGEDPSTDFRGGGYISLENLIFFAQKFPDSFQRLLHKKDGTRADWEYPFAVAGINVSFMLAQMLDLNSGIPSSSAGIRFLEMLEEDEMTFDNLYCIAFQMMDAQWLAKRASYMDFNDVLKATKTQLERELALEDISSVKDIPAYNLLR